MLFAISALDKPQSLDLRLKTRPTHLAYWQDNAAAIVLAGPYLDPEGKPMGSLLVVKAEDAAGAEALIAADPYAQAGLFDSITVRPWNWVINAPETI